MSYRDIITIETDKRGGKPCIRRSRSSSHCCRWSLMKLLFDQNLSRKLVRRWADIFPGSSHV